MGPVSKALASEREYSNDEQIDDALRSVLFRIPKPGVTDPRACELPVVDPLCFTGVQDLGAVDIERARDHGIPAYNALREAYGIAPKASFGEITGEATDPADAAALVNAPAGLAFVELRDRRGNPIPLASAAAQAEAVTGARRTNTRRSAAGRVRGREQARRVRRDDVRAPRAGHRVRRAATGHLAAAVRGASRRRSVLLRERPTLVDIQRRYGISFRRTLAL